MDGATLRRLRKLREDLSALIADAEQAGTGQAETHWHIWFRRAGAVLNQVDAEGGAVDAHRWRQIGIDLGYDPRGLAGFYTGNDPSMRRDPQSDQRYLTERGKLEAANWRRLFAASG
jgi:hypothetical protein